MKNISFRLTHLDEMSLELIQRAFGEPSISAALRRAVRELGQRAAAVEAAKSECLAQMDRGVAAQAFDFSDLQ